MRSLLRIIDGISLAFMWVSVVFTWALVIIVFCGVLARYFFNSPSNWIPEFSQFIFGASFMLAGAHVLKVNGHVRIDTLIRRLSRRGQAILECITAPVIWIFTLALLYKGAEMAMTALRNLETSGSSWDPPVYPIKIVIPLAAALIMIQSIAKLFRDINSIIKGN